MKNKIKFPGIVALAAIIMVSTVFASCSDPSISGTFSYDGNYIITFLSNNTFSGTSGGYSIWGTFSVIYDKIYLKVTGSTKDVVFTIIDNDTLLDPDGDIWNKRR